MDKFLFIGKEYKLLRLSPGMHFRRVFDLTSARFYDTESLVSLLPQPFQAGRIVLVLREGMNVDACMNGIRFASYPSHMIRAPFFAVPDAPLCFLVCNMDDPEI